MNRPVVPAPIEWAQRSNLVYIRIAVEDVKSPQIQVEKNKIVYKWVNWMSQSQLSFSLLKNPLQQWVNWLFDWSPHDHQLDWQSIDLSISIVKWSFTCPLHCLVSEFCLPNDWYSVEWCWTAFTCFNLNLLIFLPFQRCQWQSTETIWSSTWIVWRNQTWRQQICSSRSWHWIRIDQSRRGETVLETPTERWSKISLA